MAKPVCVVAGIGPGNGAAFARRFAADGYAVALLSRAAEPSRELAAALPDAALLPLTGCAHFPWFDDADAVVGALRRGLGPERPGPAPQQAPAARFSRREREVIGLVAQGLSDKEIAEQLVLSRHTVHRHVANIRRKLGRATRAAAVAEAARLGLL